jgi:peroxiredoxin
MPAEPVRAAVGSAAPDSVLEGRDGEARLSDYWSRQPVLLVFMRAFG